MKKSKKTGEPFEELNVVTGAGYEKGKRRDKSINKRAGLHDKRAEGDEKRVFRRKPLAVKHKRRLRKAIPAVLAAMAIAMVIVITGSYTPPVSFKDLDGDYRTVCYELPADGSSPEEHTVVETIGYLNYALSQETYWASDMEQSLSALFNIKQSTYNHKKYYNGKLISVDIARGASTSAKQFCQTDKVVLWRDAVDPNDTNGFYTNWKDGKPSGLTISEFKKKRGLPPGEFSVYVLNENTVLNADDYGVVSNDDGTYSITADLNVNTKSGEENNIHSAVYYYKQQMAVTGGLSQLPTYYYTNVTYTFDENYRLLNFVINDSYEATLRIPGLGEVTSPCSSTTVTTFNYEEDYCKNSVYDDFKSYENDFGTAEDDEATAFSVNATNCLAGAFASVLSDGAVFKLDLGLGGKTVDGVIAVSLKDGGIDAVSAKLGNITAHALSEKNGYGLYLALGQNKYKVNLGGVSLPAAAAEGDGDMLSGVLDTLLGGDFAYDSQSGLATLSSQISLFGIDLNLDFAFGVDEEKEEISLIDVKANIKYENIDLDATLKFGANSDKPADLTAADKLLYKDILNEGIALGVNVTLDGKLIQGVAKIDLSGGEFAGVRAKLGDAVVHYGDGIIYIAVSGSKIKLPVSSLGGASGLNIGGFNLGELIKDILDGVNIDNGLIKTSVFGADVSLDLFSGVKADVSFEIFGASIKANVNLAASDNLPANLSEKEKEEYVDVTEGFSATGTLNLTLGGEQISIAVNNLAISFENSLSFKLDATLLLNNTYNNFYIEYLNGVLTVSYGALQPMVIEEAEAVHDIITVRLDLEDGDLTALEKAIVKVYNRILAVYNEIAKQSVAEAGGLADILNTLGIAKDGVNGLEELLNKLAIPTKDGKLDLNALINSVILSSADNGISATLGNIFAQLNLTGSGVDCGANITFGTASIELNLSDAKIRHYVDFEVPTKDPLDKDAIVDMLDYLGATADMLLQHSFKVSLEGTLYNSNGAYGVSSNVKYIFNALLEYDDGGNMPVTYENGQLFVSNDLYVHFKLDLVAQTTLDESLYLDVYILDANPKGTSKGLTSGGYTADGKSLDFYVSVSKFEEGSKDSKSNPLKFYGSMEEVLSILSMGTAMLNLQDINTDSKEVNDAVAAVYNLLNGMLLENYIPTVKSQFASLGESLIPNILKTDLSSLLNKVIAEYESVMDGIENKTEITEGNFIKGASCANGQLNVTLNSANLFGIPEYNDLTFYIEKTAGEKSLISGVGLNNIYFGDNGEKMLNLAAKISYDGISKPDSASAFKNYNNFDGLDKLLLTAVNSATHETTEEERAAGYFADYKLNSDYFVDGNITANIKLLGFDLISIPITVNALHVNIDENNDVSVDATLSYKAYSVNLLITKVPIITDTATVDISIRKGMIYIRKAILGGVTSYRIMPASTFTEDIYEQIAYILSFSDTVNSIADLFGSSEPIYPTFNDYGDYIDKFVTLYEYSLGESSSNWNITVNGKTLGNLAGMDLDDLKISFNGSNGILNNLSISGGLASVVTFSGTLNYLNPNEKFAAGASDLSTNVASTVADGLYYSWTEILGGDTLAEIDKHFKWGELAGGETGYLSYSGGELTFGGYTYIGASYETDGGYAIGTLAELKDRGISGVKLDAIWMKADIAFSASRSRSGSLLTGYKYKYTLDINSVNIAFLGNAEVINNITLSDGVAFGYVSNGTAYEPNAADRTPVVGETVFAGGSGGFTCGAINFNTDGLTTSSRSYGHVVVQFGVKYGGCGLNTWAHSYDSI